MRYNWPGNIRELENAIRARGAAGRRQRASRADDLRLGEAPWTAEHKPRDQAPSSRSRRAASRSRKVERQALLEALKMSNWVQKDAAELLSISPRVMNYKIKTLGIELRAAAARRCSTTSREQRWCRRERRSPFRVPGSQFVFGFGVGVQGRRAGPLPQGFAGVDAFSSSTIFLTVDQFIAVATTFSSFSIQLLGKPYPVRHGGPGNR